MSLIIGRIGRSKSRARNDFALRGRTQPAWDLAPAYHEAGAFFLIAAERLMADTVEVYNEFLPLVLPRHKAIDIDEPEDLEMAKILFLGREAMKTVTDKQAAHRA